MPATKIAPDKKDQPVNDDKAAENVVGPAPVQEADDVSEPAALDQPSGNDDIAGPVQVNENRHHEL